MQSRNHLLFVRPGGEATFKISCVCAGKMNINVQNFKRLQSLFYSRMLMACALFIGCNQSNPDYGPATSLIVNSNTPIQDIVEGAAPNETGAPTPSSENRLVIGLDADMSSGSAKAGEALRRGIVLALDEINSNGGLQGKKVQLEIRDHRGNPDRGVDNLIEFSEMPNLLAVVGGIHTPVALKELPVIHEREIIYLGPWAAGTPVVSNGYDPNYVFRVSVRDEYAGGFLVDQACQRNLTKIGLLLERTGWGRSNEKAITNALKERGLKPLDIQWFNWGEQRMENQVFNLLKSGCDAIILVCNPLEGAEIVNTMAAVESAERVPIISHWGISAGNFFERAQPALEVVDVTFVQSFSFLHSNLNSKAKSLAACYQRKFPKTDSVRQIFAPVGTAHAYEIVMMLADAVASSESTDSRQVRRAMEQITQYQGVIREYEHPFPKDHHDALDANDFILARFASDGAIVPVEK